MFRKILFLSLNLSKRNLYHFCKNNQIKSNKNSLINDKKEVKLILKRKVPVDSYADKNTKVIIHDNITYASTLNQSDV